MNQILCISILAFFLFATRDQAIANSGIINVYNGENLQEVIDNSPSGSVFYLHAGNYGNITLTKKVTILSKGYFLTPENAGSPAHAVVGTITFDSGSEQSMISGFQCGVVSINVSNVIVQRCYTGDIIIGRTGRADNAIVKQNYGGCAIYIGNGTDFVIKSNIICAGVVQNPDSWTFGYYVQSCSNCFGIIENNTFDNDISGNDRYGWDYRNTVRNNIIPGFYGNGWNAETQVNFKYNIWGGDNVTNYHSSNIPNIDKNTLFVGWPTNTGLAPDARNQLALNSPARGAGVGSTDAGAFGGDDPYVLSGIPDIPSIYYLSLQPSVPQSGTLQVQIKAKTNN
jgi:hypothetical protein